MILNMITAKIAPVKYNSHFDWVKGKSSHIPDVNVIELEDVQLIKENIIDLLFKKMFNYLLVSFGTSVFVVERDSPTTYCKREVTYHPLMELVKL